MKVENILNSALHYSEYSKGGEYSASDIIGEPLQTLLKKKYPKVDDVKAVDKVAAWVGTGTHLMLERFIEAENAFSETNMESEVKLKYRNLSGTADVIVDGNIICDLKTSKEVTLKKTIKEPSKWVKQLSIYNYLNHKQNGVQMNSKGYILWIAMDSRKIGTLELELLTKSETIQLIKDFMVQIEKPLEEQTKCTSCSWLWKWCSVRSKCPHYSTSASITEDW